MIAAIALMVIAYGGILGGGTALCVAGHIGGAAILVAGCALLMLPALVRILGGSWPGQRERQQPWR